MFCASWLLGPAAGPNGDSIFSLKMGSAPPSWRTILRTPNTLPRLACSVRIQSIICANGIGLMMSLMSELLSCPVETARRGRDVLRARHAAPCATAPRRPSAASALPGADAVRRHRTRRHRQRGRRGAPPEKT